VVPGGIHKDGEMTPVYKELCHGTRPDMPLVKVGEIPKRKKRIRISMWDIRL